MCELFWNLERFGLEKQVKIDCHEFSFHHQLNFQCMTGVKVYDMQTKRFHLNIAKISIA